MPLANVSYGLLTSRNQGGGNKKQGLPPTMGLGPFSMNIIQRVAGYCQCPESDNRVFGESVPVGGILLWAGDIDNPPDGWLVCDGSELFVEMFPELYSILFDYDDPAILRFNLPDLRGKFVRGSNTANPTGTIGGSDTTTLTASMVPEHQHKFRVRNMPQVNYYGSSETLIVDVQPDWSSDPTVTTRLTGPSSVSGTTAPVPVSTVPRFYSLAYIIKY